MSVLEIVLYSLISLLVLIYISKIIREIIKGKKAKNQKKEDEDED